MKTLNPPLYALLEKHFGEVRVTHEGEHRVEERDNRSGRTVVLQPGEAYNCNCSCCGDTRGRLSISYLWLTKKHGLTSERRTDLANCYNENCEVRSESFYGALLAELEGLEVEDTVFGEVVTEPKEVVRKNILLPDDFLPLHRLPSDHPVFEFIQGKYPHFDCDILSKKYCAGFCENGDLVYPLAAGRLIFPIFAEKRLVGWQGRTICSEIRGKLRWYIPPGFKKCVYNLDRVPGDSIPVVTEGIPAAIGCGDNGVALFGKSISEEQARVIGGKFPTAIIATDPETMVPDNREGEEGRVYAAVIKRKLDKYLRTPAVLLEYPPNILEQARQHNAGGMVSVPDPADIGPDIMLDLIKKAEMK